MLQTALWATRPLWFAEYCQRHFGDAYALQSPSGQRVVHVTEPRMIQQVLDLDADAFRNADPDATACAEVGAGPYVAAREIAIDVDSTVHKAARKQAATVFYAEQTSDFAQLISGVAQRHVASWPVASVFPVYPRMQDIAREILLRSLVGVDGEELAQLNANLRAYLDLGGRYAALWIRGNIETDPQLRHLQAIVESSVACVVTNRRADPSLAARSDSLSRMLRDPKMGFMSDPDLASLVMAMLLAGNDPLATMLAWSCDYLCHDKELTAALRSDLRSGSGRYAHAFIREVLRIRPVIPEVARTLRRRTRVGQYVLPAGVTVVANLYLLQRRPEFYPDPDKFRPERFLNRQPDTGAFLPFGGGIRRCLGAGLAMMMLKEVLRVVVLNTQLEPAGKSLDKPRRRLASIVPKNGVPVRISR